MLSIHRKWNSREQRRRNNLTHRDIWLRNPQRSLQRVEYRLLKVPGTYTLIEFNEIGIFHQYRIAKIFRRQLHFHDIFIIMDLWIFVFLNDFWKIFRKNVSWVLSYVVSTKKENIRLTAFASGNRSRSVFAGVMRDSRNNIDTPHFIFRFIQIFIKQQVFI
jgi:hypothetical protein